MATTTHYFTGIVRQAFLVRTDQFGNYTVGLEVDDANRAEITGSGLTLKERPWDGHKFYTFRRPDSKKIKEELVKFGPPTVLDANGQPLTKLVGKGSKVTLKVVVYDSMRGKGHRLDTVRVDELVEYVPEQPKTDSTGSSVGAAPAATPRSGVPF